MKYFPFSVVSGNGDKPEIEVEYKGEKKKYQAEEISAAVLTKMKTIAALLIATASAAKLNEPLIHPETGLAITTSMQTRLQRFARTAIGAVSSPISGRSLDGKSHALADFRGKYVLVDFWASWCVPCRVENRLYNQLLPKYVDHPFAIFAVNLDDSRQIWEMASKRDRVVWPQISDSLGWQSPLAAAYNVTALPMSFLMDPDGRIIGRNLRGEDLEAKLAELFE